MAETMVDLMVDLLGERKANQLVRKKESMMQMNSEITMALQWAYKMDSSLESLLEYQMVVRMAFLKVFLLGILLVSSMG